MSSCKYKRNGNLCPSIFNLKSSVYKLNENPNITVNYQMHMTLIDDKVLNVLTATKSTQCCPICGVTPTKIL